MWEGLILRSGMSLYRIRFEELKRCKILIRDLMGLISSIKSGLKIVVTVGYNDERLRVWSWEVNKIKSQK